MKKFRAALPALALAAAFAALLRFPQEVSAAVTEGLRLSVSVLIPSLFPFFICVNLTSALGLTGVLARVFAPVMRQMFHVSGAGCTAVLCGAAGGYPSGAQCVAALYREGQLSRAEAEYLLLFCNNAGPAFLFGAVGTVLGIGITGCLLLWGIHLLSALVIGLVNRPKEAPNAALPPVQRANASGAVVAVLYLCFGGLDEDLSGGMRVMALAAIVLVCAGVIGLGVVESREDDELRRARQAASNYRYAKSWLALALPVAYCLLDAAGTFADSLVLRSLDPDSANCAYELTFLFAAAVSLVYVKLIRHDRFQPKREAPKYIGALFETAGQFAYIYAIADEDHVMYAAPIIAAYCAASVLWSRIFLREKLSWRHYMMLVLIVAGIVLLGILDI